MNAKTAKKLRRLAEKYTPHLPEKIYIEQKTKRLGESTRGAYRALKTGGFRNVELV